MEKKHTTASGEDYLEAILMLQQKHGTVRSVDVSHQLEVSKASVSYAVTTLRQGGFLTMEDDFSLHLTDVGREVSSANSNGTMGFTYYARNCYDTLVTREGEEIVPALAETWEISDDGLTYTFHLKEGVKFSDGADLNAEAVKTSIEAAFSNMGDAIAQFGKIGVLTESVEAVDEYTVVLHLTSPYYGVLSDLAMCNPMAIVSPNAFNEDLTPKDELMNQTMGTGPYLYEGDGDGTFYTFVRNPNYWDEAPDVDSLTVKVISDPESAVLALRNGEVDLLAGTSRLSFAGYTELSSADGIGTTLDDSVSNSRFIGFNTQKAPFNDAAVRQAVAYAIDKETISTARIFSLWNAPTWRVPPA